MPYFIGYLHMNDFVMCILRIQIMPFTAEINIDYEYCSKSFWDSSTTIHRLYRVFHAYLVKSYLYPLGIPEIYMNL